MNLAALVLAAGASTRFAGGHKLIASFRGQPMVSAVLRLAAGARVRDRLVMTGARAGDIAPLAEAAGLRVLHNPDFIHGLSTSLQRGLAALPADCDGALILLGDMPLIRPETIEGLIATAEAHPEKAAIIPTCRGEWGHPVLLRRVLFADLAALSGDRGARSVLQTRDDVLEWPVDDPGILADLDTREALAAFEAGKVQ